METVWVPHDCTDGFLAAYWRRPERYLDPDLRACNSALAQINQTLVERGIARLAHDLATGTWHERHADDLTHDVMDWGYRLIVCDSACRPEDSGSVHSMYCGRERAIASCWVFL